MSLPRGRAIGAAVFLVAAAAMALALVLWVVFVDDPLTPDIVLFPVAYLSFAAVGSMILSRHPTHPIGLLAAVAGIGGSLVGVADSYARQPVGAPGQAWAAWIGAVGFPASLGPIVFLILLFPTGRLASPRWRVAAGLAAVGFALVTIGNAFTPTFADYPNLPNPLGIAAFEDSPLHQGGIGWFSMVGGAVLAAAGLVPRLRRATGIERQQLKWVTYAGAIHGASWIVLALELPGVLGDLAQYVLFATLVLIPVAAGVAILRYRLYDIDVVIRRTLVYGAVIVILGAGYVGLVLASQALLSRLTGSDALPVALSTLAIAALFGPVRSRVRDVVDRRFYRSRYDAQQTLERFAARLRDEVELDRVADGLATTARRAVQPASVSVWIRHAAQ
jgi:hypothetical protein